MTRSRWGETPHDPWPSRHLATLIALALGALGCDRSKSSSPAELPPDAAPSASAVAEPVPAASSAPELPSIDAGPAPASDPATKEARERAVLDLLSGGEPATRLPRDAVDPGATFDPGLRDRVAPRKGPSKVRVGAVTVEGALPPEVIQRIVRQQMGRFRLCYDSALREQPDLSGTVSVAFVIDAQGAVGNVTPKGPSPSNAAFTSCMARSFSGMSFPAPEKGVVHVTCPVHLGSE
jgi:hypothetical protein